MVSMAVRSPLAVRFAQSQMLVNSSTGCTINSRADSSSFINLDNQASIALAQSVGMQKECIRRGFFYENEQWVDHFIYVALPSDLGLVEKPPAIAA